VLSNGQEKIKLEQEAISEILVADTDLQSGAEATNVEDNFEEEVEEEEEDEDDDDDENHNNNNNNNNSSSKPQQKSNHRLQQVVDYQPGDLLKEGAQIFILLSVQQKV